MMTTPYPTAFSNPLAKWVWTTCSESVFHVVVEPRRESEIKAITTKVDELKVLPPKKRKERCTQTNYCTGFAVEEKDGAITILTSAHCIDHMFCAGKPITAREVRKLFSVKILCEHYESGFRASRRRDKKRYYNHARVLEIDCSKDLLLLEIDASAILLFDGSTCPHAHAPLLPSRSPASELEAAVMVSWPPTRPRTSAIGEISHCGRDYDDESSTNPHGYDMTLVEVNIPGQEGSSGAPLLDGCGCYFGMLHGREKDSYSCFVSLDDILQCLSQWGVACPNNPA